LGLGERFAELAARIDVVFHLGANVNYIEPYSAHKEANVSGTINVLRRVTTCRTKSLHFASTIAAFGPAGLLESTLVVYEDDAMEHYLAGLKFDSGYSQSKWIAEQLVREAQLRGIPVSVYRPWFIMGDNRTGAGNQNDFVARLVKGCFAIGAHPTLPRQGKQFVPVDYVSAAMVRIASRDANLSRAYYLVPPADAAQVDLIGYFELLGRCGYPLEALSYARWVKRLSDDSELNHNALTPLVAMLAEPVYGQLTRWEGHEGMSTYDTSNTARALREAGGITYPPLSQVLLKRYLDYWTRIGFPGMERNKVLSPPWPQSHIERSGAMWTSWDGPFWHPFSRSHLKHF
jgi:thioester reductase-like protein